MVEGKDLPDLVGDQKMVFEELRENCGYGTYIAILFTDPIENGRIPSEKISRRKIAIKSCHCVYVNPSRDVSPPLSE